MSFANQFIFGLGVLLLLSVVASRVSERLGAPLLLVFLVLGMLAGEEGLGRIAYDNFFSAALLASLALAVILFDGGLHTRFARFRTGFSPALSLATLGVVISSAITGVAASLIFDMSWLEGLLIGSIVGSTDAAAVFYLLRAHGLHLNDRVHSTLEIESGSNDPMAVFLTITFIGILAGQQEISFTALAADFGWQMGMGAFAGAAGGWLLAYVINNVRLADSLYPLFALAGGVVIYGLAATVESSGFLAAYIGGLMAGNYTHRASNSIRRFHDGMAWLSQIGLFLMLGLLVTPSALLPVLPGGLLTAFVLVFIARPIAVMICLAPFKFSWREQAFISWVGLRGAVPIVLGLFPLLGGLSGAYVAFNIAFCVVLVSLVLQGWTVAPVARWLRVQMPPAAQGKRLAEYDAPGGGKKNLVVYEVVEGSQVANATLRDLAFPPNTRFLALMRAEQAVPLTPLTVASPGDHVYLMSEPADQSVLDELFGSVATGSLHQQHRFFGEFVLAAEVRLSELVEAYGVRLPKGVSPDTSLGDLFSQKYRKRVVEGDRISLEEVELVARHLEDGRVSEIGLKMPH
jgi:cell volume regulation protein A